MLISIPIFSSAFSSAGLRILPGCSVLGQGVGSVDKFFATAAVAKGEDELGCLGELGFIVEKASTVQVDVSEEKRHGASLGGLLGFGQVLAGKAVLATDEIVECGG